MNSQIALRQLGQSELRVTPVAMGCWPIAGMTSLEVNDADSRATLAAALECGINFFDTAYAYGAGGESERLLGVAVRGRRDQVVLATKGGLHWDAQGQRQYDARPETLIRQCDASLQRLGVDHVDLFYLHAPDPRTPLAESGGALKQLLESGKARTVGASNCNLQQLQELTDVCPLTAIQPPYNMLQRQIQQDLLPWCAAKGVSAVVYWPLMKGLLAGKLPRDYQFQPGDGRAKYPMYQGQQWLRNQDFVDELRVLARDLGRSVAELVINWTIRQSGITAALCGAKRAYQIQEVAAAMTWQLDQPAMARIQAALARRAAAETT